MISYEKNNQSIMNFFSQTSRKVSNKVMANEKTPLVAPANPPNTISATVAPANPPNTTSATVAPTSPASPASATAQKIKRIDLWGKIAKLAIYLVIFLTPIFVLPWTINTLDYSKQMLLIGAVFVIFLAWLLRILSSSKIKLNMSMLGVPVALWLIISGISTFYSKWSYGSFWGWPLHISASFVTTLCFVLLYFLITNIFSYPKESKNSVQAESQILWLLFALIMSGLAVAVLAEAQIFGHFFLPWDFTKNISFNTVGTINSLAIFLAVLVPIATAMLFISKHIIKFFLAIFLAIAFFYLIIANFWGAWLVVIAGATVLFIFGTPNVRTKKANMRMVQMAIFTIVVGFFFLFFFNIFKNPIPGMPEFPAEVSLKQKTEFSLSKQVSGKARYLGTGPGTFVYHFTQFKPANLNQTAFWNTRFSAGASEFLDQLITAGILGAVCLALIYGLFWLAGFKFLTSLQKTESDNQSEKTRWILGLGIFAGFTGIAISQFLYPANFTLLFLFWFLLALLATFDQKAIKIYEIVPASSRAVGASFLLVVALIFSAGFFLINVQKYVADVKYLHGLKIWQEALQTSDIIATETLASRAIAKVEEATKLNPGPDIYWQDLSQMYLGKLNVVAQKKDAKKEDIALEAQNLATGSINASKQAIDNNPSNVANWNVRGLVLRNLMGVAQGASEWAITANQKASELEPTNPYIFAELGRVYLAKYDLKEGEPEENLRLARESFEKSIALKFDYAPSHFQIAMSYAREGKLKEAEEKLEQTKQVAPSDIGLAFQLGIIYFQDNQLDKARAELERAVKIDTNYSNARYYLGVIYDQQKKKKDALEQFEKIAELNPSNEDVPKIIDNIKRGKPALDNIQPSQPPIEEKPAEVDK